MVLWLVLIGADLATKHLAAARGAVVRELRHVVGSNVRSRWRVLASSSGKSRRHRSVGRTGAPAEASLVEPGHKGGRNSCSCRNDYREENTMKKIKAVGVAVIMAGLIGAGFVYSIRPIAFAN